MHSRVFHSVCHSSDDLPVEKLKVNVGNSLKSLLTRLRRQEEEEQKTKETKVDAEEEGKSLSLTTG